MTQLENDSLFLTFELEGGIKFYLYERANDEDTQPLERVHIEKEKNGKAIRKQIINVYCDKCKEAWLNDSINEYDDFDQTAIRIGALMVCTNRFEVYDMLKEMKGSEEFKREVLQAYIDECDKRKPSISIVINK